MRPAEIRRLLVLRRPQLGRRRRLSRSATVEDLGRAARRRWPRGVRDYVDGGADGEVSLQRNREAYESFALTPDALRDVASPDLSCRILGRPAPLPFLLGPTGMTRMMHPDGELAAARAAASAGIGYTLSTMSTVSIEDVAATGAPDLWFQLYVWRDRGLSKDLLRRAQEAGYRTLVITVDCAVSGMRVRDRHNGFSLPPQLTPAVVADMARHPGWCWGILRGAPLSFANFADAVAEANGTVMNFVARQFDPSVTWSDVEQFRALWDGPVVLKGAFGPADAQRALAVGVDGLVLSNHGGRQLDQVAPPILTLPQVRAAVGDRLQVFVDSGIRRGSDIAIALASGADGCLIGRPYLYGLGVAGEQGCAAAIDILATELQRTIQLLGIRSIGELRDRGSELVHRRADPRPAG
jgi:L-lactate dehydrogenase (cytochrome)